MSAKIANDADAPKERESFASRHVISRGVHSIVAEV